MKRFSLYFILQKAKDTKEEQAVPKLEELPRPADKSQINPKKYLATIFIMIGFIMILISIIMDDKIISPPLWQRVTIELLSHLGIGSLIIGVLNVLLDMHHWTDYFKERLADIVTEKKYLENLKPEGLLNLQLEVLKAYFKDSNISGSDGFLKYYEKHIQEMIGGPFRMNVENDFFIRYCPLSRDHVIVSEKIIWDCRSNGGNIQKEVRWLPEKGEFLEIYAREINFRHKCINASRNELLFNYDQAVFEEKWKQEHGGFIIPLKEVLPPVDLDELKITVSVNYKIAVERFIASRMAHPSREFTLTIRYPDDLCLTKEIYCMSSNSFNVIADDVGYFKMKTDNWVLPEEGVAFQLLKNKRPVAVSGLIGETVTHNKTSDIEIIIVE
jgi:hypothetical protein